MQTKKYGDYLQDRMMERQQRWAELDGKLMTSVTVDNLNQWIRLRDEAQVAWIDFLDAQKEYDDHRLARRRTD